MTEYSYSLIYHPEDPTPIDITAWVDRIDAIEVGSGEIRSSKIRLNAVDGRFITKKIDISWTGGTGTLSVGDIITTSANGWQGKLLELKSGNSVAGEGRFTENSVAFSDVAQTLSEAGGWSATYTTGSDDLQNRPIIDQFDKLRLTITDRNGDTYDVIYEVDNIKPIQNSQVGNLVEVHSLGMEWHLMKTPFAKPYFEESSEQVSNDICDMYQNDLRGAANSPNIQGYDQVFGVNNYGNDLPVYSANVYPFNLRDQSCYSALMQVLDKAGSSIASGGAGDFFEIGFNDDMTDPVFNTYQFRGFISGSPPDQSSIPTIEDSLAVNPGEEEGGLLATPAFVQGTWAGDGIGTLPWRNGMFQGALEIFNLYPNHQVGVTYPANVIVTIPNTTDAEGDLTHYKSNKTTSATPPHGDWDVYFFSNFLTNEVNGISQYSEWTNNKATDWESCFGEPNGDLQDNPPDAGSVKAWDMNQIVVDGTFRRTWCDYRTNDPANVPSQLKFGADFYRGFRVLVDTSLGAAAGDFVGHDNEVVQFTVKGTWRTFRAPADKNLVCVDHEGQTFQYDQGTTSWINVTAFSEENDAYHPIYDVFNGQGMNDKDDGAASNFGANSAVVFEFQYHPVVDDLPVLARTSQQYYRQGAWINFRFPFPPNDYNTSIIGQYYGDVQAGSHEPVTLDAGNMHLTHDGNKGFNNAESMDLGPLDGIRFNTQFSWVDDQTGNGVLVRQGNMKCRCFMFDSSDNVVIHDFVINFNGEWTQTIELAFKDFKIYRGRKPWAYDSLASNVFLQQLEILNVFEWKNIQKIGFVWLGPYDDDGRYAPWSQGSIIAPTIEGAVAGAINGFNIRWAIDAFEFAKIGLVTSAPITQRPTFLPFENEPQIPNMFQAKQHNDSMLEIAQFRRVRYDLVTEGTCKERFGDSIFVENSWLVRESAKNETTPGANDGDPNTVKLVCKRIRYEITKPSNGPGGFLRYIEGVKRFIT
jgi:hypothetical protein